MASTNLHSDSVPANSAASQIEDRDAKFWAVWAAWRAAVNAFEGDDSPEGTEQFALLEDTMLDLSAPMLCEPTRTAEGLLAKLTRIHEGGCTLLDVPHDRVSGARVFDQVLWDVERLAKNGVAFVPYSVPNVT